MQPIVLAGIERSQRLSVLVDQRQLKECEICGHLGTVRGSDYGLIDSCAFICDPKRTYKMALPAIIHDPKWPLLPLDLSHIITSYLDLVITEGDDCTLDSSKDIATVLRLCHTKNLTERIAWLGYRFGVPRWLSPKDLMEVIACECNVCQTFGSPSGLRIDHFFESYAYALKKLVC